MDVTIQTTVSALGYIENDVYKKEPDCADLINDLSHFLKRDNDQCSSRRIILRTNVVQSDLIPIMCQYSQDHALFNSALKNLIKMKYAFINEEFMKVIADKIKDFLNQDWTDRDEDDQLMVDRLLLLIRNVLHMPDVQDNKQAMVGESSIQDRLLWCILESGLTDLFLFSSSNKQEKRLHLRVMEIIMLMLKYHSPSELYNAGKVRNIDEKRKDQEIMEAALQKQLAMKKAQLKKCTGRHTSFAGSYTVKGMKGVNDHQDVVSFRVIQPEQPANMPWMDSRKKPRRTAKNKAPVVEKVACQKSALKLRQGLGNFCEQFVDLCYNQCMMSIKAQLNGSTTLDRGNLQMNETFYYWGMQYFLEYGRLCRLPLDRISESLSLSSLHQCQTHLDECLELRTVHKDESRIWGRRAHVALQAYKQLLLSIVNMMSHDAGHEFNEQAKAIQGNIFYETEYRDLCLNVLKQYQPWNLSKAFLKDLVDTIHTYLRLLERYMKADDNQLLVKKKRKKAKKRKNKEKTKAPVPVDAPSLESLDELWDDMTEELCAALQGHVQLPTDAVPFDSAMQVDDNTHMKVAMGRIQKALRDRKPAEAAALYRASRELWPTEGIFGKEDIEAEEEFLELRQILTAEIEQIKNVEVIVEQEEGDVLIESELEDEQENDYVVSEVKFQFDDYVARFARPDVLKWYIALLGDYSSNGEELNRKLIKMLHRIVVDLKFTSMLFQARLFRVFQNLWKQHSSVRNLSQYRELRELAEYVSSSFFKCLRREPKVAAEVFFWKNNAVAYEIEHGYGSYENEKSSKKKGKTQLNWEQEERLDEQLRTLYDEFKNMPFRSEALTMLDYIELNLTEKLNSKQIIKKLRCLGLDTSMMKKGANQWTESMDDTLRQLVETYRNMTERDENMDVLDFIVAEMNNQKSRAQIKGRLQKIGLQCTDLIVKKSAPWSDELQTELMTLVEQFKMIPEEQIKNMPKYVASNLSEKRSLKDIRTKLAEAGLIQKRKKKSQGLTSNLQEHADEPKEHSFSDDSVDDDKPLEPTKSDSDSGDSITAFTARFNKDSLQRRRHLVDSDSDEEPDSTPKTTMIDETSKHTSLHENDENGANNDNDVDDEAGKAISVQDDINDVQAALSDSDSDDDAPLKALVVAEDNEKSVNSDDSCDAESDADSPMKQKPVAKKRKIVSSDEDD